MARHARHLGDLRRLPRACATRPAGAAGAPPTSRSPASRSSSSPRRPPGDPLLVTRMNLISSASRTRARRLAVRERAFVPLDAGGASSRRELAGAAARPSASRPATAPSSTSSATDAERRALDALVELSAARRGGAARRRLPALRRGGGAAPLPGRGGARLDGARRGRDPRPGARRLRGRDDRAGARPPVPPGAARRQEGARRDGDRREPGVGLVGGGRARTAGLRTAGRMPVLLDRRRSRRRARRPQPGRARREDRVRRQPLARACRGAGQAVRGRRARLRARRRTCSARSTSSSPRPARRVGRSTRDERRGGAPRRARAGRSS